MHIVPLSSRSIPLIRLSRVLFRLPLLPRIATNSPRLKLALAPCSTSLERSPSWYSFSRFSRVIKPFDCMISVVSSPKSWEGFIPGSNTCNAELYYVRCPIRFGNAPRWMDYRTIYPPDRQVSGYLQIAAPGEGCEIHFCKN